MSYDPEKIIKGVIKVVALPQVFVKVDKAINDPYASTTKIADIIGEDPSMALRVLRVANSAFYNFMSTVETVSHAITIIGTQQLRDIVLACSVITLFDDIPEELMSMEKFWCHSVGCGVAARSLAEIAGEGNVEQFFLAGLLHDIGKLVLLMELPKESKEIMQMVREQNAMPHKIEKEVLGFDHARLGGLLLEKWQIPERLQAQVAHHHQPTNTDQYLKEASIIHMADLIANALAFGTSGATCVPKLSSKAFQVCGLTEAMLPDFLEKFELQYRDAIEFILDK